MTLVGHLCLRELLYMASRYLRLFPGKLCHRTEISRVVLCQQSLVEDAGAGHSLE